MKPAHSPTVLARWLRVLAAGLLASAAVQAPPANAWVKDFPCGGGGFAGWGNGDFSYRIDTDDFPTTGWKHDAIHAVVNRFEGHGQPIAGSDWVPVHGAHTTGGSAYLGDGISSVTFDPLAGGFIGETRCRVLNCVLTECDIVLDSGESWMDGPPDDDSSPYSFRATFAHELGHAAGFGHQEDFADTMNSTYPFGGSISKLVSASENIRDGLRSLYPDSSTAIDLGNSAFFWTAVAGKAMRSPNSGTFGCQQDDDALPGGPIKRSHCVHALGTTTETVTQTYYLSTDTTITTADTVIGTFSMSAGPDEPTCPCRSLTIPSGTPAGAYRIGSLLDPSNAITEANESNNDAIDVDTFTVN